MKLGSAVVGIIIAGGLGYVLEPSLRSALVQPAKKATDESSETAGSDGKSPEKSADSTLQTAPAWVSELTPGQLPESVTLNKEASFTLAGASAPMVVPSGVQVKPVRVEGADLVINFAGSVEGKVPVMSTSLVKDLGNKPPAPAEVAVVEPVKPDPVAPDPVAPEPATPEPAMPESPKETPEPVEKAVAKTLTPEEIVAVMQESVKGGEIKEFAFDQVLSWEAADDKEMGGESFQSGLASYKAETIFGVKNIQAQALIKGGKVEKWIWPKSGMEIK